MKRNLLTCSMLVVALACPTLPHAQTGEMKDMPAKKADGKAGVTHQGKGIVKSLDAGKGTVVLAHDAIQSLNWPAMSMTFKAKDKAMLEKLKPGAKVDFSFVQSGKDYVVMEIR